MLKEDIQKLARYIEEHLRTSKTSGFTFIDTRNLRDRIVSKQNHVIFGRRGAGKSTLISSITDLAEDSIAVEVNLEDYKGISFPNIVLHVLRASFQKLYVASLKKKPWYKFSIKAMKYRRRLSAEINSLSTLLDEPDEELKQEKTRNTYETASGARLNNKVAAADVAVKKGSERETSRSIQTNKLNALQLKLTTYKNILVEASDVLGKPSIFLVLDDFYFVPKSVQPDFLDYFHRLCKGSPMFLKMATIKHRSHLYRTTAENYVGVELGHDIFEVDLDYSLDKFEDLQHFMKELLMQASKDAGVKVGVDNLFSGEGFLQLCLASGGVPRDFLSFFLRCVNLVSLHSNEKIGKIQVNEAAIASLGTKMENFKVDSDQERELLETYLNNIKRFVYDQHRTNMFLVAKEDLDNEPQGRQALRELVDLRLLHLVDSNTSSAPSDGRRYEAYILDVGLYENPRPRNFDQLEPGSKDSKSRKDAQRSAPKLSLGSLRQSVKGSPAQGELFVTD